MLFLFLAILLSLLGFYYFKTISKFIRISTHKTVIAIISSLILCFLWILGILMGNAITPFMLYFTLLSLIISLLELIIKKQNYYLYIIPFILSLIINIYGYNNFYNVVETKYYLTTSKPIPATLNVVFISDVHYGGTYNHKDLDKFCKKLSKLNNIDILILGRDIIEDNTSKEEMNYVFSAFGKIQSKLGTFYVYGNHDKQRYSSNKSYSEDELYNSITINNIQILEDSYITINNEITLIGRKDKGEKRKNLEELIDNSFLDSYTILIDHQPTDYTIASNLGVDLILSGHTHAGQLFPGGLLIDLFKSSEMSYGYELINNTNVIVSSGLSGWGFPIRTSKNSEYVNINISQTY